MGLSRKFSISISITIVLLLLLLQHSNAQNSRQDFLNAHNIARKKLGLANVTWSSTVETYARNYANSRINDCLLIHSTGDDYGENIAKGYDTFSGVDAVNLWVAEKPYYNYTANCCVPEQEECLHYTQVVWRSSIRIGCARVQCKNSLWKFVTCNYDPPGNYIDERPY